MQSKPTVRQTALLAALTLGVAQAAHAGCDGDAPSAAEQTVTIVASEFRFDPAQVTVEAGKPVTVILENEGVLSHNLKVEQVGVKTETIQPDAQSRVSFTPEAPGEYKLYCGVPGHREAGMVGTLLVR